MPSEENDYSKMQDIRIRLNSILSLAPSDSSHKVDFQINHEGNYESLVQVHSREGHFIAHSCAKSLVEAFNQALDEIQGKVLGWNQARQAFI